METKKHILFLCSWFPNKNAPTLGNFVQKHAESAAEIANIDVLFATSCENVRKITITDNVVNNVRTVIVYFPKTTLKIPFLSSFITKIKFVKALKTGYRHLNQTYHLVHLNVAFPAGIFALKLTKKDTPYIITEHSTSYVNDNFDNFPWYLKKSIRTIFSHAKKTFVVSDYLGENLKKRRLISSYETINNIIQEQYFYPANAQKNTDEPLYLVHISTLDDKSKNISGILNTLAKLNRDYIFHIITETDEQTAWEMIEKQQLDKSKFIVESQLSAPEIGEVLRKADCLVHFSNYETFSIVIAEAWSCGIPAIYSKCGGLTEINNPELGIQIAVKDEKALLNALTTFKRADYSTEKIHNFSKQFSAEKVKAQLVEIYSQF